MSIAAVLVLLSARANVETIASCSGSATERECYVQIGKAAAIALRSAARRVLPPLVPFISSAAGGHVFGELQRVSRDAVPDVVQEIEAIAEGAQIHTRDMWVMAMEIELGWFARKAGLSVALKPKSCSDYHSLSGDGSLSAWVHNEDGDPVDRPESFLVNANISGHSHRIGFAYAHDAGLAGWAWSVNAHGLAQSVNALNPANLTIGVPDSLHARHVAGATSLDDAIHRACSLQLAGGQHFNVGSYKEAGRQLMIEASNVGCDVRELAPRASSAGTPKGDLEGSGRHRASDVTIGYHANLYESAKLKGIDGGASALDATSSLHRMRRMAELPPAGSLDDLLAVVSDTNDPVYPIHRPYPVHKPDLFTTLNSVLFDAHAATIAVWGPEAPTRAPAPTLEIDWRTMSIKRRDVPTISATGRPRGVTLDAAATAAVAALPLSRSAAATVATAAVPRVNILVGYHSQTNRTAALAKMICDAAAREPGAVVRCRPISSVACSDLTWAHGIALGSPVYWAAVSAEMKRFLDDVQQKCFGWPITQLAWRAGAAFTTGAHIASGKEATLQALHSFFLGVQMVVVGNKQTAACELGACATNHNESAAVPSFTPAERDDAATMAQRLVKTAAAIRSLVNASAALP